MPCTACLREKPPVARGLCNACYQRWRKTGTTEYQRWGKRTACGVGGCDKPATANGLCAMHLQRMNRHGHVEDTRPDSWGAKHKHPLFHSWAWMRRHRGKDGVDPAWESDFLQFVMDVGERPSPKHKLFAADDSKPIGPTNFVWKRAITERADGEDLRTYGNRVQKVYRAVKPEAFKGYDLKRTFGLSRRDYDALSEEQGHACAICREPERVVIRGRKTSLAVDHCHTTGAVRGLLCAKCNRGLGLFDDDMDRLKAAVGYLERHKNPSDEG